MNTPPVPTALWTVGAYCAVLVFVHLGGSAPKEPAALEAQMQQQLLEVEIRMSEAVQWLDPESASQVQGLQTSLSQFAEDARNLAFQEHTPPAIREQAAAIWLIYSPATQDESEDTAVLTLERVAEVEQMLPPDDAENRGVLGRVVSLAAAGETITDDDWELLRDADISPWLRSRLHAHIANAGTPIESNSGHAGQERLFMAKIFAVFAGIGLVGIAGLILLIVLPFVWKRVPHGLAAAGPAPFVLTPYGGWFVLLVWFAGFLTLPIVYEVLSALFFAGDNGSMVGIVLIQVMQGLVGLWAIGTYGMAGPRQTIPNVLGFMRLNLDPFDGNPLRALTWGLTGYAVAIPAVVIASLIQFLLPFDSSFASGPIFEWLIHPPDGLSQVLVIVAVVIIAPFFEECLFRGFLYRQLRAHMGIWKATFASAAVFSLAHMLVGQVLPLFALGIVLAMVKERSGGLMPCILVHAFWNGATVIETVVMFGG
jgi:membrane protease YdiL (CAAX protease family)